MPLDIVRNDITKMQVDAIVNAANSTLQGGGGVDGAIHAAAGPQLLEECRALHGCPTGEAKITKGYLLPCRYVIHTVGPVWQGGTRGERDALIACYRNSLELAAEYRCESVAFPLISAGAYGYPKDQALQIAVETITGFLMRHDMLVYIVVFTGNDFMVGGKLFREIDSFIDDVYAEAHYAKRQSCCVCGETASVPDLDDLLNTADEDFGTALLRKIDEKRITDAECYKRANIDRRLFNKIKNTPGYKPGKRTALAFAIALKLTLPETQELLKKAGLALSHSDKTDIVVEYCIRNGQYDIFEINEILFHYDLALLGC